MADRSLVATDEAGWLESLIVGESARLFRLAYGILRDAQEAEDATQETFARAWRARRGIRTPQAMQSWLTTTCVRECLRRRRVLIAHKTPIASEVSVSDDGPDPDLERAVKHLSAKQRAVITLHYQYGYSLDECADLLKCRPGTVRSHIGRALTSLRKELR